MASAENQLKNYESAEQKTSGLPNKYKHKGKNMARTICLQSPADVKGVLIGRKIHRGFLMAFPFIFNEGKRFFQAGHAGDLEVGLVFPFKRRLFFRVPDGVSD